MRPRSTPSIGSADEAGHTSLRRSCVAYFLRGVRWAPPYGLTVLRRGRASELASRQKQRGKGPLLVTKGPLTSPLHLQEHNHINAQLTTQPTLEMIDPRTLTVDLNVRKDAALTPEFVASIKEHGVIEPVIGHRKDDGTSTVHVLMGQRSTRGAFEAGTATIPVMVVASPEEAERITTQVVENVQCSALTDADEADAYHQLSLLGVSAAQIAKKTGRAKTAVEGALKAKKSAAGEAALAKGRTIEEALVLVEFADDENATEHL